MMNTEELQRFFLLGGLGHLCRRRGEKHAADLPGSKSLRYGRGPFLYVDMYFVNGTISCGQTLISHDPVQA